MNEQVFISYKSEDFQEADLVRSVLEENGISCWMAPKSIPAGGDYTEAIPVAIDMCKVFVLVLSEEAQKSRWISAETERAFKSETTIIPFAIENCKLSNKFDFLLSMCQRIEAFEKQSNAFEELVNRIKCIVNASEIVRTGKLPDVKEA